MKNHIEIFCLNKNSHIKIKGGETLYEVANRINLPDLKFPAICAMVNNKNESLDYPVYGAKTVKFLDRTSPSGRRVYIRSLCMILYRAIREVAPELRLRIEHSIGGGYFCRLLDANGAPIGKEKYSPIINPTKEKMRRIVNDNLRFERKEQLTEEIEKVFEAENMPDKVLLLQTTHDLYTTFYSLDGVVDNYYGALAPSTGLIEIFDLEEYKDGMLLTGFDSTNPDQPAQKVTLDKMFTAFLEYLRFDKIIGADTVGKLNRATLDGRASDLINVAEALHDKKIASIADDIASRYRDGGARIVLLAGPSSSGKTTTTKLLGIYLMTNLLIPRMISLDDYFLNREETPRDETGDYDFESIHALDLKQFNADLNALLEGKEIEMPTFNFELGRREYKGRKLRLKPNEILLIEGIHGLNPKLTTSIADHLKYKIYVSALTTLSIDDHNWIPTTDNRLLRRIIRDYKYRGTSAIDTIRRWPSVRRGEEKWIFPFQENADNTFNSSLIFELAVMKDYAETILREVPNNCPEYAEAYRLRKFLSYFTPISQKDVPPTSLLREFLGGSSFRY